MRDPGAFWGRHGKRIDWIESFSRVKNTSFAPGNVSIEWFGDGMTNVAINCIDRHLGQRGDQVAIVWEGDDPAQSRSITYRDLHEEVCRFANVLESRGVKKGDRVTIYLPMIPEAAFAMLTLVTFGTLATWSDPLIARLASRVFRMTPSAYAQKQVSQTRQILVDGEESTLICTWPQIFVLSYQVSAGVFSSSTL